MSRHTWLISGALGLTLVVTGCQAPGPVVPAPAPPSPSVTEDVGDTDTGVTEIPAFAEACESWDTQELEWRELTGVATSSLSDPGGTEILVTSAALPEGPASRYNAAIEVCPGFLWVLSHEGTSRFIAVEDKVWAAGPTVATSGETGSIQARGVSSGGPVWGFRDALAVGNHVFLSDAVIDVVEECVRQDVHRLDTAQLLTGVADTTVVYSSTPCVSYVDQWRSVAPIKTHFGGALAFSHEQDELYLTIGDFHLAPSSIGQAAAVGSPGLDQDYAVVVDSQSAVSVVVAISQPSNEPEARIVATGLRNSLGIAFSKKGDLWLSDHGPSGGDEINIIVEGADYGWPLYSTGRPYDQAQWPSDPARWPDSRVNFRNHNSPGITGPEFTWSPAVAPSELVLYEPSEVMFPDYVGDMLLGTLRGQALIRLSTDDSGVITETRLPLGERIRDLSVLGSGHIVALTDSSRILILSGNE